jgi:hypothetical protein
MDEQAVVHYLVLSHLYTAPLLLEASLMFMENGLQNLQNLSF